LRGSCSQAEEDGMLWGRRLDADGPSEAIRGEIVGAPIRYIVDPTGLRLETQPSAHELQFNLTMDTDIVDTRRIGSGVATSYICPITEEDLWSTGHACTQGHPCRYYPLKFTCGIAGVGVPLDNTRYYCPLFDGGPSSLLARVETPQTILCHLSRASIVALDVNGERAGTAELPTGCSVALGESVSSVDVSLGTLATGAPGYATFAPAAAGWQPDDLAAIYLESAGCAGELRLFVIELACIDN